MSSSTDASWRGRWWDLPPLILHPFDRGLDTPAFFDSIRLSLHLAGLGEPGLEKEKLLRGRYVEFRMLCLVGKDVMRWMTQCVDFANRDDLLVGAQLRPQSFADLLVNRTPSLVAARFESWGVVDYRRVLSRGIGVNSVFPMPPDYGAISGAFLEDYYSYADHLFACYQSLAPFPPLDPSAFGFSLYTSDEFMSKLECGSDEAQA